MIALNYWHYLSFLVFFTMLVVGIKIALNQEKKLVLPMLATVIIIPIMLSVVSVLVIDKYTKEVKLYKLKSKRLLSTEQVVYTGIVKNEGDFTIGKVTFEIKLVNNGHTTGKMGGGAIYKPSTILDLFSGDGAGILYKPQSIKKEFVVAKNLKAGTSKSFRVYFKFPPYFRNVAFFAKVSGH